MKRIALNSRQDGFKDALKKASAIQPQLVLVFASPSFWRDKGAISDACTLKDVHVIGCSTAGEISGAGASEDTCSVMAIRFDSAEVKVAASQLASADMSLTAGKAIGDALKESRLRAIFTLAPGLHVDGTAFAQGVAGAAGDNVLVTGGLAGDGMKFKNTFTMLNGMVFPNLAVAFGLYGENLSVKCGTRCGWKPFGLARRVTKSTANILFELDGKPALQLYQRYLGDRSSALPSTGLLYPFSVQREDGKETGVVRNVLAVNPEDGSMTLAGDLPQGSIVRLMYADPDLLIDGAAAAGKEAVNGSKGPSATLLVSCAGRRLAMGDDADAEVAAVIDSAGDDSICAGFYSYGDIAPSGPSRADVHGQSITVTHIGETAP
ncbi:MAG: FIST signal transduction protein [Alphaproteobacteria bacterium]